MSNIAIQVEQLSKEYKLGLIGGGTLKGDIQSWWSRRLGKEDPNSKIGSIQNKKRFLALDNINFSITQGEAIGLIGHNGAGKSTLLKIMSRITTPTKGQIKINGRIASLLEVGTGFHPELTGRENIFLNGAILGMTKAEIKKRFDEIVAFSEVEQFIDTPVKRYSSGMFVKLGFSVAAHLDPEILIVDEVLAVGDMKFQQKCLGKMGDAASNGRTVLYVSHNMNTIQKLCNRAIVLDHGRVIHDGNVDEAILKYIDNTSELQPVVDLEKIERQNYIYKNRAITLVRYELKNNTSCKIETGNKLYFELVWRNDDDSEDDIYLRAEIRYATDASVATAFSDCLKKNKKGSLTSHIFCLDTSFLAPGKYYAGLNIYRKSADGFSIDIDNVRPAFRFEITQPSDGMVWKSKNWGYIKLPDLSVIE